MTIRLAIGSDHRGFLLKEFLRGHLSYGRFTIEWHDVGAYTQERSDYPVYGAQVAELVQKEQVDGGVLLCGSGVGMSLIANRFAGVRAGLVWTEQLARMAKEDDNVTILVLPADCITQEEAQHCILSWITAEFKGGRYAERIALIELLGNC